MLATERCLMTKQRRTFTPKFKREAAALVLDQGYSHIGQPDRSGWLSQHCADGSASSSRNAAVLRRPARR
jgi:transposase-like protein